MKIYELSVATLPPGRGNGMVAFTKKKESKMRLLDVK
jgi:hypothetical protein